MDGAAGFAMDDAAGFAMDGADSQWMMHAMNDAAGFTMDDAAAALCIATRSELQSAAADISSWLAAVGGIDIVA